MLDRDIGKRNQPYAVLGAGDLVSHLYRDGESNDGNAYRFNLFRLQRDEQVTHTLRPNDLRNIVKLCQVMAFTIADDGWITDELRKELFDLADDLDYITHQWSDQAHGSETTA